MILKRVAPGILLLSLLASGAAREAHAQAQLAVEPPSSLYAASLGDDDVELLVQGFWEAGILSSGSMSFGPGGGAVNAVPFLFMQRPDLYLLLRFRESWWFEASVAEEAERSVFALGFSAAGDEWVRDARLGNSGIAMPRYPYLAFGEAPGAFGASLSALDLDSGSSFDAMLRWDGLRWVTDRWFGLSETRETELDAASFLRGRRFSLPHPNV